MGTDWGQGSCWGLGAPLRAQFVLGMWPCVLWAPLGWGSESGMLGLCSDVPEVSPKGSSE